MHPSYRVLFYTIALTGFVLDQASKYGTFAWLQDAPEYRRELIPGALRVVAPHARGHNGAAVLEVHYCVDVTLPPDEFVAQLGLGLGRYWLDRQAFAKAIRHFRAVADQHKGTQGAAQALFWLCVAEYTQSAGQPQPWPSG